MRVGFESRMGLRSGWMERRIPAGKLFGKQDVCQFGLIVSLRATPKAALGEMEVFEIQPSILVEYGGNHDNAGGERLRSLHYSAYRSGHQRWLHKPPALGDPRERRPGKHVQNATQTCKTCLQLQT
jgi:hypothetical protein